jgi:hypothetical protein
MLRKQVLLCMRVQMTKEDTLLRGSVRMLLLMICRRCLGKVGDATRLCQASRVIERGVDFGKTVRCIYLQSLEMPDFGLVQYTVHGEREKYFQHSAKVVFNSHIGAYPCMLDTVCLSLGLQPGPSDTIVALHVGSYNIALALGLD